MTNNKTQTCRSYFRFWLSTTLSSDLRHLSMDFSCSTLTFSTCWLSLMARVSIASQPWLWCRSEKHTTQMFVWHCRQNSFSFCRWCSAHFTSISELIPCFLLTTWSSAHESHKVLTQSSHVAVAGSSFRCSQQAWHNPATSLERSDSSIRFWTTKFAGSVSAGVRNKCRQNGQGTCQITQNIRANLRTLISSWSTLQ